VIANTTSPLACSASARARQGRRVLTEDERACAQTLGKDLEAVWQATTTTMRDRKRAPDRSTRADGIVTK
jgi:hypothetical protein